MTTALLWILGIISAMAGMMKLLAAPKMMDDPKMAWVAREGLTKARIAGAAEVAAAMAFIGTAVGIGFLENGIIATVAAGGLALTMGLAIQVHLPHDEPIIPPAVIGALSVLLVGLLLTS